MKELEIIVSNERLKDVDNVLREHKVGGMHYYIVTGWGITMKPKEEQVAGYGGYRTGREIIPEFTSRTKVHVIIPDEMEEQLINKLVNALSTGSAGDGKIFVKGITKVVDIGSKKVGEEALWV
jgi:nitrogen regulatory protein P-II 1